MSGLIFIDYFEMLRPSPGAVLGSKLIRIEDHVEIYCPHTQFLKYAIVSQSNDNCLHI